MLFHDKVLNIALFFLEENCGFFVLCLVLQFKEKTYYEIVIFFFPKMFLNLDRKLDIGVV